MRTTNPNLNARDKSPRKENENSDLVAIAIHDGNWTKMTSSAP